MAAINARWDGIYREIPVPMHLTRLHQFSGTAPKLSVSLMGISKNGQIVFKTFGGISLPYLYVPDRPKTELRKDLFTSNAEVSDGVQIALQPLFPKTGKDVIATCSQEPCHRND